MAMDERIREAITEAVKDYGQNEQLAERLIAWFEAAANGNERIQDQDSSFRRLDLLTESTKSKDEHGPQQS